MVRPLGFEPRTCGLRVRCSAVELEARLRRAVYGAIRATQLRCIGVTDGTRTRDIQDHNLALYQLNYGHHVGRQCATPGRRLHPGNAGQGSSVIGIGHNGFRCLLACGKRDP